MARRKMLHLNAVMPPGLPSGLASFVEHVIPIVQRRGLVHTEYEGETLREDRGLARLGNANLEKRPLEGAA